MAVGYLPNAFLAFLDRCGVEANKVSEVYELQAHADGRRLYSGFYHLVGRMIDRQVQKQTIQFENMDISFQEDCDLLPDSFPRPVLQLNFTCDMPWILDEIA